MTSSRHADARGALLAAAVVLLLFASRYAARPEDFWRNDFQLLHLPASRDVARAWSHGEAPLLISPASAAPLAAEFQSGVFSLFVTACNLAVWAFHPGPVAAAALLSGIHLAVLAAGAFRLARRRGLLVPLALMVAMVTSLNGYMLIWAATDWYPALTSFAWLPWFWWSAEPAAGGRLVPGWIVTGGFLYLLISAGWPYAVLAAGVLTVSILARFHAGPESKAILISLAKAWALGLALAAPALLMLVEWYLASNRFAAPGHAWWAWTVPPAAWLGLGLPSFHSIWITYEGPLLRSAMEMEGALVPLAGVLAGLGATGLRFLRSCRWEVVLVGLTGALATLNGFGPFSWSFRWLPLFHLAFALLGGLGLQAATAGSRRRGTYRLFALPGVGAAFFVAAAWLADIADRRATVHGFALAGASLLLLGGWAAAGWRRRSASVLAAPWVVATSLALSWLTIPFAGTVPRWRFGKETLDATPLDPARRYVSLYSGRDAMPPLPLPPVAAGTLDGRGEALRIGNTPQLAGLDFLNGYSAFVHRGLHDVTGLELMGCFDEPGLERILAAETGTEGLLAYAAVDGLLLPHRLASAVPGLLQHGWRPTAANISDVIDLERPPQPRVRSLRSLEVVADGREVSRRLAVRPRGMPPAISSTAESSLSVGVHDFVAARVTLIEEGRNSTTVRVAVPRGDAEALVLFARIWFPGMRASLAGRELPVERIASVFPAVRVPPDASGRLELIYRPRLLQVGLAIAALGLISAAIAAVRAAATPHGRCGSAASPTSPADIPSR
ncbi:MAG TPA: hypothetical protein VGS57_02350 [Thermoanaerobaculia bacterium]|nr:hypothetical protein [Thermoanaerobaculia bacterium]